MANPDLVATLGLKNRDFIRGLDDSERRASNFGTKFHRGVVQPINKFGAVAGRAMGIAGIATAGAVKALDEYAKVSSIAERQMESFGRKSVKATQDLGREMSILAMELKGSGLTDLLSRGLGGAGAGFMGVRNWASGGGTGELHSLLRENERMDLAEKRRAAFEQLSGELGTDEALAASPEERRRIARDRAIRQNRDYLRSVAANPDLTGDQRADLIGRSVAERDERIRRIDRAPFGAFDDEIRRLTDQQTALKGREAMLPAGDYRDNLSRELSKLTVELERLSGKRDILENVSLSAAEQERRMQSLRTTTAWDHREREARIEAEARARAAAGVARGRSVRDQIIGDQIDILGASGNTTEARRLALGLEYTRSREAILGDSELSKEQREALLASNKSRFEAEFAGVGSGFRQQTLGAGLGGLSDQVFNGPGPQMLDVAKESQRILDRIEQNTRENFARAG